MIRLLAGTYVVPTETTLLIDSSLTISSLSLIGEPGAVITSPPGATAETHERRELQAAPRASPPTTAPHAAAPHAAHHGVWAHTAPHAYAKTPPSAFPNWSPHKRAPHTSTHGASHGVPHAAPNTAHHGRAMRHEGGNGNERISAAEWLEETGSPLITISSNQRPVVIDGLTLRGSSRGPAIAAVASDDYFVGGRVRPSILISRCAFVNNSHTGALRMLRVVVVVRDSVFQSNAAPESRGGAIDAQQSFLSLRHSRVERNAALRGGGIHVTGNRSFAQITGSTFEANHAQNVGGAIATSNAATVLMANGTALRRNTAASGRSIDHWGALMVYQLPAPTGSWLASTIQCFGIPSDAPICTPLLAALGLARLQGPLNALGIYYTLGALVAIVPVGESMDHDYPLACGAGFFGEE